MEKKYTKNCPKCGKEQNYNRKYDCNFAIKHNLLCQSCSKIDKHPTEETRKKFSILRKGNKPHLGIKHSEESKIKMRNAKLGKNHPMFGKKGKNHPLYGIELSGEHKEKISQSIKGIPHTDEHKRKIRVSTINAISQYRLNGNQLFPRYSSNACKYFDKLNKENGWNLQHAMNGGEYFISHLGYWIDGYDKNKKIIVEYDEKYHNRPFHIKRDLFRQNEIINYIHPNEFWRYSEITDKLVRIV